MSIRSRSQERVKLRPKAADAAQDQSNQPSPSSTIVPLARLVQKVSERDNSFLNRITLELLELFASGKPTPGAGSAAALMAALSGSLTQSVAQYTLKAARRYDAYVPFKERAEVILEESRERSQRLCNAVDEDSAAFDQYWQHWRLQIQDAHMEGASASEKAQLRARTSEALRRATAIPIEIAEDCVALAEMGFELYDRGYRDARGETCTAILSAIANGEAAVHTARINLQQAAVNASWVDVERERIRRLCRRLRGLRTLIEVRIYDADELV